MNLESRIGRLEQAAGRERGPCAMCQRRDAVASERRPVPPGFVAEEIDRVTFNCPRCGRPDEFVVVQVGRADAEKC